MRALRIAGPGDVAVADVPVPEPAPGEILVRVERAALCATDRKMVQRGVTRPLTLGHEAAGRLSDGTLVGIHPDVGCGRCRHCRQGHETRCPDKESLGVKRDGALAQWVAVRAEHAVPMDGLDPAAVPILEPLACCVHAIGALGARPGTPALVVGGGVMGILNAWVLVASGCAVAVVEPDARRRALAHDLGLTALDAEDAPREALGGAPQLAVVTVPDATALASALEEVDVGGAVHAFASVPGGAAVDANLVHSRHVRLVGSTGSNIDDYERARRLVSSGHVPVHRLPVDRVSLGQAPGTLRGQGGPHVLKTIVDVQPDHAEMDASAHVPRNVPGAMEAGEQGEP